MASEAALLLDLYSLVSQVFHQTVVNGRVQSIADIWGAGGELSILRHRLGSMLPVLAGGAAVKAYKDPHARQWVTDLKHATNRAGDVLGRMMELDMSVAVRDGLSQPRRQRVEETIRELKRLIGDDSQAGANLTGIPQSRIAEPGRDNLSEHTAGGIDDLEAGHGHPPSSTANADQTEQRKRLVKYSERAFLFVISMLIAYAASASSNLFRVAFAVYCAALFVAKMVPRWGRAMVYVSSFLLVLGSYLLLLTSNKKLYAYAIVPTPLPILAARYCRQRVVMQADDQELDDIFESSSGVAIAGGFVSFVLGRIMGPSQQHTAATDVAGFLFFFTVALGIYLMAVTTVRIAVLTAHATHLYKLLEFFIGGTVITAIIGQFISPLI